MFKRISVVALLLATAIATSAPAQQVQGNQPAPAQQQVPFVPPHMGFPDEGYDGEGEGPNPLADPFTAMPAPVAKQAGGFPGDEDGPPIEEELVPQNPVRKAYENGKIIVLVGSERHFGYRIGDTAPVTIMVLADDSIQLNFDAIQRGMLGVDGSDFELVEPATPRIVQKKDGKTLYRIDMKVRSFVPKKGIAFTADFMYATGMSPDGKTLNWRLLTTPEFVVTTSNTADNGTDLLEGDMSEGRSRLSWFTFPLLLAGLTLVLAWPSLLFWQWYRRVRPPKVVPANELAWKTFNKVLKDGKAYGFTCKHYKQIAAALRRYLGVEPATLDEVRVRLKDRKDLKTIESALSKCDAVLYAKKPLDDAEHKELVSELEAIVPRP